ncbi:MAG: PSD1 and planctomycete cytochrome C domain-containing protein, partial [Planctomycetaceae bacterium]
MTVASFGDDDRSVDYDRDIRPILTTRCLSCHGSRKQDGGLRLDVRKRALAGGDHGAVIVVGDAQSSALIRRVTSKQPDVRMPAKGQPLTASQIGLLRRWIDQGATGLPKPTRASSAERHWAFQPIRSSKLPPVTDGDWPRNSIDQFVLSHLNERNIVPSPAASRATLIRRVYLDLIGLPPAWSRVLQFVSDPRPDAYERLVDELLASPRYGERWGRHWLDLARYADSTGYESDQPRQIWAYRDWVINALNADMAFDQFVIQQLAGDLLPGATRDQQIATGFHCNAMLDPGVRQESILDQVNTTGAVFLGLTTGCAQCHAHKTDPLTQREFYQLYAFFNEASISELPIGDGVEAESAAPQSAKQQAENSPPSKPTTLVMKHSPQPTHIFIRGDHAHLGERVLAGFPAFLNRPTVSVPPSAPAESRTRPPGGPSLTRFDLATWLVSPDNPLTARVTANRVWQRFFGLGLVETENDFGLQTPQPLHSALLDYLAGELRGEPQSSWRGVKPLQRLIVTSATYRQSSKIRAELNDIDPHNRLLSRQRRLRLEAELIRDIS